jgi:DNA polymerase-4
MAILQQHAPVVEQLSVDEAFLDVTSTLRLLGPAQQIGEQIRARIRETLDLTASVGIGPNRFLAKLASDHAKPDGLLEIRPDEVLEFLAPLPVTALWGVGETTAGKLQRLGFGTLGQVQQCPLDRLIASFGKYGQHLHELAHGIDRTAVQSSRERKSVSHEQTFAHDTDDAEFLHRILLDLAEQVGRRLRRHQLKGRTITLKLRFADFRTITRSTTLARATCADKQIYRSARALLDSERLRSRKVRLIGVAVSNLDAGEQLALLAEDDTARSAVDTALDEVRERFGPDSVRRARLVDDTDDAK